MEYAVYFKLFKKCIQQTILSTRTIQLIALLSFSMSLASAYILVKVSDSITVLTDVFKTPQMNSALYTFFFLSFLAFFMKYIPKVIYSSVLQYICRNQFVAFVKEYLQLNYTKFHQKTPGEMRYSIFLKSFASVMCGQMLIFEISAMLGTSIFSFLKITNNINFLSGLVFALSPIIYLSAVIYYVNIKIKYQSQYLIQQEKISTKLYDKLINYDLIKTYNLENSEAKSFYTDLSDQMNAQINMGVIDARGYVFLNILQMVPYITLVLIAFHFKSSSIRKGLFQITILYTSLSQQLKRLGRELCSLMMYLNQIKHGEIENIEEENQGADEEDLEGFTDSIEFKNLTLYHGNTQILQNINAKIIHGEKIAIVGRNGTGKSTLVKALLGFTRFTGEMLFDGRSTAILTWKSILRQISYIPQNDYTSDDTIMNNLRLGDQNASDEFIKAQAQRFGVHQTFEELEDGYETMTGPRGNRLSGGQLQKLSLVRAAVKNAPIFILDEATAAMDKNYEAILIEKLFENLGDRTVMMIVHGKEHLRRFDRIFYIDNGMLECTGSYDKLIKCSDSFREFIA